MKNSEPTCAAEATCVIAKYKLVDVHHTALGCDDEPAYSRGSTRLDYIFMTQDIASLVCSCGAKPFNRCFFSDPRGLYIDLRLSGLFDRNLSPLASLSFHDIGSGTPKNIRRYLLELNRSLLDNNFQIAAKF
jgi:hypothetical protein